MLTEDRQLLALAPIAQVTQYRQSSMLRSSYASESVRDAPRNLALPAGNPRTREFARGLRERYPDDTALIAAVLAWFHDEAFVYTLAPPLLERDPVDAFLFDTRRGFCEHYASAFAVLLRAAGIPTRIVTGYQGGEINPRGGYLIVRQADAHAWTEALVDGQWRRYDPTAAVAPSRIERGLAHALSAGEAIPLFMRLDAGWLKDMRFLWDAANHSWRRDIVGFNRVRQRELWRNLEFDTLAAWKIATVAFALVMTWAGAIVGLSALHRRRREPALALWDAICERLARAGLKRHSHEGPLD